MLEVLRLVLLLLLLNRLARGRIKANSSEMVRTRDPRGRLIVLLLLVRQARTRELVLLLLLGHRQRGCQRIQGRLTSGAPVVRLVGAIGAN